MSTDGSMPRSRRAVLAAAAGAAAVTVITAIERPLAVAAVDGDVVHQGDSLYGSSATSFITTSGPALEAITNGDDSAVIGQGLTGAGLEGRTTSGFGVYGWAGESGVGVHGKSDSGIGVQGWSNTGTGVAADGGTAGVGVRGWTPQGVGVIGSTNAGTGVQATATTGTALDVVGKARFSRSKKVTIGAGKSSLKVTLEGVTTSSLVFAVLHSNRSGVYVQAVVPSTGSFTIYLNKAPTSATFVAYFVVN